MVHEVGKRSGLAVFLTHEQHRREGRQEHRGKHQLALLRTHQHVQAFAVAPVADLVVVLAEHHETPRRQEFTVRTQRFTAVAAPPGG